jgi:hypothetical protein
MHYVTLEDDQGEAIDLVPFCCASCARDWSTTASILYPGWAGCQESEHDEWCARCGVLVSIGSDHPRCDSSCYPAVVNLILDENGEPLASLGHRADDRCPHGVPQWLAAGITPY